MNKEYVAKVITFVGWLLGLVVAYQAVRFCQGSIGAPILDQVIQYYLRPFAVAIDQQLGTKFFSQLAYPITSSTSLSAWVPGWIQKGVYYLLGIFVWLHLGLFVQSCARAAACIYVVGFAQYCDEVRAARAEAERQHQIYVERERRRELRRKQLEAKQPRSGFSVTTLVAGIVLGMFFF
ncbi:hypothetical protein [Burkholderia ubonensis]|uniref:hypothetical protein n=1 Tax=Burkholderia ubonensis TaxID=101571 RepID=UPI00075ED204|nr:hypothetical protein [Burkholderia ubonensis]KVL70315.1 hypothetical protein WJ49_22640 [Burkholderia ubonensis]KVL73178.1 hypothetical protein WJ48_00335 [Burkholderia ubonensis]KVL91006.1 hypothetical protein WJ50_12775 [Burkholderia ubonensis]